MLNASVDHQVFILICAAMLIWGITSFLVHEDGPFDLFLRFRELIGVKQDKLTRECTGKNIFAKMLCCFKCTSFWVAIPIALLLVNTQPLITLVLILVLRTGAIILDRIING